MAFQFNDIEILGSIRGNKYPFKAAVEAASISAWGGASGSYSAPTLTIIGLSAGSTVGAIDGVTSLALNSRVLIKDAQSLTGIASAAWNGIWYVAAIGTNTSAQLVRAFDLIDGDSTSNINVWVRGGTNANTAWVCTSNTTVDTSTNTLTFAQYDTTGTLSIARGGTGLNATVANRIFATDGSGNATWSTTIPTAAQGSITHANLGGLAADDHTQYALLVGRVGGQTLIGGTAASNNLVLQSTSNASRGVIQINDPVRADSLDSITATTLTLGSTNATKIDISKSSVTTEIKGTLTVKDNIDVAAAGALNLGTSTATSILIGNNSTTAATFATKILARPASTFGIDTSSAGILYIGETSANAVYIANSGSTTRVVGPLRVQGTVDTITGTALSLGTATATSVAIAQTGVTTTVGGTLLTRDIVDTSTATILRLGPTTATSVELGATNIPVRVRGDLLVDGTTTSVASETILLADNFLYLNAGYTTNSSETGGLAINYLPTTTTTTATGSGFTSTTQLSTVGAATFAAGSIIQISGAVNVDNNGLYVVATHAANVLTLDTTVYGWNQTSFVVSVDTVAVIYRVNISVIRANVSGDWTVGKGSAVPISYSTLATASTRWSFQPISNSVNVTSTAYTTVAYFPFDHSAYGSATTFTVTLWVVYNNRALDIQVYDGTSAIGSATGITTTGITTFTVTVPGGDRLLEIQCRKASAGGTNPLIRSLNFDLST